ncbi:MAG: amidohydrolase [Rhodobacteraceae bacterium]|uniref:amidohydrolase n=1 Tax=Albidovulum sp. TaxID=1872424 RepID=UPI001D72E1FC|nr:amidohydrolase [Paracoccaceae bacterium]MCC0046473.1 amidohydrolase [Defluviimonas sp.]HPE26172.1 amidohydrolase family protein [Albidovulum sp.]MCB2119463.1 amidohydrolase [Paracoccaceae bacterium]MCB2123320.1 amidohydrolase [Paracoccaceae bacterium]
MRSAELIVLNADIRTLDPRRPRARALAVAGGKVLAAGDEAEIRALAAPGAEVIDAKGRQILPGFHDTHIHVQDGGQHYAESADLSGAMTIGALQQTLREFAATHDRKWVLGAFYYSGVLGEHNLNRQALDAAVPDRPCLIMASDGHNGCLNTRGCEAVGLVKGTPDPENGHFVLDSDGVPTGLLYETATMWAEDRMPPVPDSSYEGGVLFAQAHANRNGFTGLLDASIGERHARVYKRLVERDALTARILATVRVEASETTEGALARVSALRAAHQSEMFRIHSAKFFLDGVIENRTAAMIDDYSDAEGGNAALMFSPNQINDMFTAFDAARFQIHVHAIGDLAVRAALDGMEAARHANAPWPSWHQIAHIQCIDPADVPRFAELGVVANIQPLWARLEPSVSEVALPMVGPERGKWMYAFRSLVDAGAMAALSSDWPVSTLNPFQIMETAMTRQPPKAEGDFPVFLPEQCLSLDECVEGYTINAARAGWREATTGSLAPGKWADFIVIDRDLWATDPRDIGDTEVLATYLSGRVVHGGI